MKKLLILTICISLTLTFAGCGCGSKDDSKLADSERLAVTVNGEDVYLDEAKYYAYSAQATNEVYYIANEDNEIDWNSKVEDGTAQNAVKGEVLNSICQREILYDKRDEYNVKLDADEKEEVEKNVENYFAESSKKLKDKIGITKKRLKAVFTKDAIAQKVQDIMVAEDKEAASDKIKDWIDDASISCEKCWADINFKTPIFSKKDAENETGLTTEMVEETEPEITE